MHTAHAQRFIYSTLTGKSRSLGSFSGSLNSFLLVLLSQLNIPAHRSAHASLIRERPLRIYIPLRECNEPIIILHEINRHAPRLIELMSFCASFKSALHRHVIPTQAPWGHALCAFQLAEVAFGLLDLAVDCFEGVYIDINHS